MNRVQLFMGERGQWSPRTKADAEAVVQALIGANDGELPSRDTPIDMVIGVLTRQGVRVEILPDDYTPEPADCATVLVTVEGGVVTDAFSEKYSELQLVVADLDATDNEDGVEVSVFPVSQWSDVAKEMRQIVQRQMESEWPEDLAGRTLWPSN